VFDGAKLTIGPAGHARLINCSFRNVEIRSFECDAVDIVGCTFSGRLRSGGIHGTFRNGSGTSPVASGTRSKATISAGCA
jgi:hypothetical protein